MAGTTTTNHRYQILLPVSLPRLVTQKRLVERKGTVCFPNTNSRITAKCCSRHAPQCLDNWEESIYVYHMWLSPYVLQLRLLNFTLVTVFAPNKSLRSRLLGCLEAMWGVMEWTMVVPSADLWSPASPLSTQERPVTHSNMGENMLSWASTSQAFSAAACKYILSFLCQRSAFQPPWLCPLTVVRVEKLRYLCPLLCAFWISKYQERAGWYPNRQSVVNPVNALRVFRLPRINILVYVRFKVNFIDSCSDITLEQIILFSMYLKRKGDGRVAKPPFREARWLSGA